MTKYRSIWLEHLSPDGLAWAQDQVARYHYLRAAVPAVYRPEGWAVCAAGLGRLGCLIVGRPQSTRVKGWYGSLEDVAIGRCEVSRWSVLCLARVWLSPMAQPGGAYHEPAWGLPGFVDRRGRWRSTLASTALRLLAECVGADYLTRRPPCFLDEPYEVRYLLSYCDTSKHRGVIYAASGWDLYRTNNVGIQTWRVALPALTEAEHVAIRTASLVDRRACRHRAKRAQLPLPLMMA